MATPSDTKLFVGGLSWNTTAERLEQYFSNFGQVLEAFVSYDRVTGRPRGFGFVVFEDPSVADRVASLQHTIDRREVEAKKAVPKEDHAGLRAQNGVGQAPQRTKKVFVGGLAPTVDETAFRQYFEQFGPVEDAVVMYDHDNKRPRGFGFITFATEESVDQVFLAGPLQALHDKQIEIKRAVPRDQMPQPRGMMMMRPPAYSAYGAYGGGRGMHGYGPPTGFPMQGQYGQPSYGPPAYRGGGGGGGGLHGGLGSHINTTHLGVGALASNLGGQQQPGMGIPGALGGNMPGPGRLGSYGGGGLGAGLGSGMSGAGDMGLGAQMGGPLGSMGGLGSGVGRYNLGSNPGGGGSFNMAALQGALPGGSGHGVQDPVQPSSLPGSAGGGGLEGGYADAYSAGGQGGDAYSGGPGDAPYGSVGTPGGGGSALADAFSGQQAAESYQSAGGLGASVEGREGYSGTASPVTAGFSAASAGFAAQAAAAAQQGTASPSAAYLAQQSPTAFNASLAVVTSGMGGSLPGSREQVPASSAFNASSFTESPLAWS